MSEQRLEQQTHGYADVLAVSLGTVVAMWIAGYLLHIPFIAAPGWLSFAALVGILVGGGVALGRQTQRTWRGATASGAIVALVNLLIIGSVLSQASSRETLLVGLPGYLLATIAVMLLGHAVGRRTRPGTPRVIDWPARLAWSVVFATGLVVLAGGLVTGFDAGFAVPDWPNTFGSNMFVFPLARMTGGIYYEHTHRLAGTLVGLMAIVLAVHTWLGGASRGVKVFALAALVMVCVQGVIGGLWVTDLQHGAETGAAAASPRPVEATPNILYILFHGTFGQVVLGAFVVLAAMRSRPWRAATPTRTDTASTDRFLAAAFIVAMLIQLALGVTLRKTGGMLLMHITFAAVVATLGIGVGVRAWAVRGGDHAPLRRVGKALLLVLGLQLLLGLGALYHRGLSPAKTVVVGSDAVSSTTEAVTTTLHQTTGAVLLALGAAAAAWTFQLVRPAVPGAAASDTTADNPATKNQAPPRMAGVS